MQALWKGRVCALLYCPNCQKPAQGTSKQFCIYCGTRCVDTPDPAVRKKKIRNGIIIVIGLSLIPVSFLFYIFTTFGQDSYTPSVQNSYTKTVNLKRIYSDYCSPTYAKVGSDGSYLSIDTNPNDIDDYTVDGSIEAIVFVNIALGLPEYLLDDMSKTTALMGRQTETFDEITVSWSYHPNKGLEVTYKVRR